MIDLSFLYSFAGKLIPVASMQAEFMQMAFIALVILAPLAAMTGVQAINFRMAFFSDAISHSAFAGVALGLIFSLSPSIVMPVFGVLIGVGITALSRRSALSSDTVIGVLFSAVVAFGLAVVSRNPNTARDMQRFLYGDILTITNQEIVLLIILAVIVITFQFFAFNRLLAIGLNAALAQVHRVKVALYQYAYAVLLSLVVIFAIRAVGVLLVTALLIVPAATARNLACSSRGMFWWSVSVGIASAVAGLLISAEPWAATATGATVILVASIFFGLSLVVAKLRGFRVG